MGERIAKIIARSGVCSRRDAERLIADGKVTLNGDVLTTPACSVTDKDVITVNGEPIPTKEPTKLWLYHKPAGLIVSFHDPLKRPTVFDNLPKEIGRVVSVGRLDLNSEGLLLLTNNGELSRYCELPATGMRRTYRVRLYGSVTKADIKKLASGISVEGVDYGPIEVIPDSTKASSNQWVTASLHEGKNRELRNVFDHLGHPVSRLIRTEYGPFELGDLEPGGVMQVPDIQMNRYFPESLTS